MIKCPSCGFQNSDNTHICLNCAATLVQICRKCNSDIPIGDRFCGKCGTPVEEKEGSRADRPTPSAADMALKERMLRDLQLKMPSTMVSKFMQQSRELNGQKREVTILVVEIENTTKQSEAVDPETTYLAVEAIIHLLADILYKYEGTIDEYSGHGMLALFGLPFNHENDPERAVRSALEMLYVTERARGEWVKKYGQDFRVRLGINTGSVIVGILNDQQHLEYTVIGDTVRLATTLQKAASSGSILVSFSTYQRTRPIIDYQNYQQGLVAANLGIDLCYQPLGVRSTPGQVRGLPGMQVPMIGRREQLNSLIDLFNQVVGTNSSRIVFCSGEAGIGKSRLTAEFRNYLLSQKIAMVQGTCALYMRITPYRVVADVIRNILGISELDPIQEQRKILQQHLDLFDLDRSDVFPYLMHVLGILQADPVLEVRIKLLDPAMLNRQIQFALRMYFIALSRRNPLVLVFDDLHWVDQPSGQFLEYLCQSLEETQLLLIMVARDFERNLSAKSIRMAAEKHLHGSVDLPIQPLTKTDAHLLVDQLVHEDTSYARELKAKITSRAGGNPYYTEEIVRILIDREGLVFREGNWHLTNSAARLIDEVPGTLSDIILARYDRLPDGLKEILLRASVLGDSFTVRLVQALISQDEKKLSEDLAELEARDFLIHTLFNMDDGYIFKHPLLPETIYKTLLKRDSQKLHTRIAEAIEAGNYWLPAERNQVLAYHYSESNKPAHAIPYFLVSGEKALQHFANDTAIEHYRKALDLMDRLAEPDRIQKEKAQVGLAKGLKFAGEPEEAGRLLTEIVEKIPLTSDGVQIEPPEVLQYQIEALCELADLRAREGNLDYAIQLLQQGKGVLGEAGQRENPIIWRRVIDRLAWVYFRQRNLDEAYNLVDLAILDTTASETDDPITMASLYNTMGGIYWTRSRFSEAIECVQHSLNIYKNLQYHWGMANSLTNLGILHYSTEKWTQAVDYFEQADRLRSEYGADPERPINLNNLSEVLKDLGEFKRARSILETSREISRRLGLNLALIHAEFNLCLLAINEDLVDEARAHLKNAELLIESLDEPNERVAQYYQLQAQVELMENDLEAARRSAEQALSIARTGDIPEKQVDGYRILGTILIHQHNYEQADLALDSSIQMAQQLNDHFSEAKARYLSGVCSWEWGKKDGAEKFKHLEQAQSQLEAAARTFETLGARYDLKKVEEIRAQIVPAMDSDEFTQQETEIEAEMNLLRARLHLPEGEWYLATVFSVVFTHKPDADDELIFETIAFLLPLLIDVIRENDGQVIRHQDGMTAIFGVPASHEDDPARAVETIMKILNFYHEFDQQTELPVAIHLGAAMGKIVAGKPDIQAGSEFLAAGEPVQLARRIAEACPAGYAWVTQTIYNHTTFRFEFNSVPLSTADRFSASPIFQFAGLREQILPVRGLVGLKTPFIGREKEIEAMNKIGQVLEGETGGIIWIEGEAGIGKSRLMREFSKQLVKYNALLLSGICSPRRSEFAFSLFEDLLMQVFGIQYNSTPRQIDEQIDLKINSWPPELTETRPFLQLLLGVQPIGPEGERINSMEPEQFRRQVFVVIHRIFNELASIQPLVVILDDLQWIDSISADLLLYLSHMIVSKRILFVCAQRQKETSPFEQTLTRIRSLHQDQSLVLSIKPLTIAECRQLLDEFLSSANLADSFFSLIIQQSGGNPYFIEEFVRLLIEKGYLRQVEGRLVVTQSLKADALTVPESLESLIRTRIDSLDNSSRLLLQIASILGHRFNSSLLSKVSEREDASIILSKLLTSGMLSPTTEEGYWEFSHPLIESIVYNSTLKAQRRLLHQRTAVVLENQWRGSEDEHAEDLAYHFRKGEVYDRALHYLIISGEKAAARHANEEAVTFFEQATELLNSVSEVGDEARWRIIHQLGEVYEFIGNYDKSMAVLQSGLDLTHSELLTPAQRAGIYRRMGDTAHKKGDQEQAIIHLEQALQILGEPGDTPSWIEAALIHARLGWCYFLKSNFEKARAAVEESMVHAGRARNNATLALAENYLGGICYRQGDLPQAMQHTRTAMSYWQDMGYSWGVASAFSNLGILESVSGNWQSAFNSFRRSLELRQKMGDIEGIAITNHNLGQLARDMGDISQAENYYRDSLAISRPMQMNWHAANSYVGLAQALLAQGRIDEAMKPLEDCLALAKEINAPDVTTEAYCTMAEIHLAKKQSIQAEAMAQKAASLAAEINVNTLLSAAWRLSCASLLQQENMDQAQEALKTAWKALEGGPEDLEKGRMHSQAMQLALAGGDMQEAEIHYGAARQIFQSLGASRDIALLESFKTSSR